MGARLREWLNILLLDGYVHKLQGEYQSRFDNVFPKSKTEKNVSLIDEIDLESDLPCVNTSDVNGIAGGVVSGKDHKTGKPVEIKGFFHKGSLVGNVLVKRILEDATLEELCFCKAGIRHGFSRTVRKSGLKDYITVESFGKYLNGQKVGFWWDFMEGGGYLVRHFVKGVNVSKGAFVYPDLEVALAGDWEGDSMLKATVSTITRLSAEEGVVFPILQQTNHDKATLHYEGNTMGSTSNVGDPYEDKWVEVKKSLQDENAGEGLFCKRKIRKGQIIAYFNGIRRTQEEVQQMQFDINRDFTISFEDCLLDIPEEYRHTDKYRASLGHKVCHSFNPSAKYCYAWHPRFGRVRSVVALRDLDQGEEITCDYKYSLDKDPPEWYKICLERHLVKMGVKEGQLESIIKDIKHSKGNQSRS